MVLVSSGCRFVVTGIEGLPPTPVPAVRPAAAIVPTHTAPAVGSNRAGGGLPWFPGRRQGGGAAAEGAHRVLGPAAPRPGEALRQAAVPLHARTGRTGHRPQPLRDPGEDVVPEQEDEAQETAAETCRRQAAEWWEAIECRRL